MMTKDEVEDLLSPAKFPDTVENRRMLAAIGYVCWTNAQMELSKLRMALSLIPADPERSEVMNHTLEALRSVFQELAQNALKRAPSFPQAT